MEESQRLSFGRGTLENPTGRFERVTVEADLEAEPDPEVLPLAPQTVILRDTTRTVISRNDSPDIPFESSINPYRGCEHGCIYCYARPYHEYLGFSAGLDFESKIVAKMDAPRLLRGELAAKNWRPQPIVMSGVTDPYQPVERFLKITRGCLAVLAEFRNPVAFITKNALIRRDLDHLTTLAAHDAATVRLSITTLRPELHQAMEPRTSTPAARLDALRALNDANIPAGVMIGPVIPGLNDDEIPAIIERAAAAGARFASYVILRLPGKVGGFFENWLARYYPERKDKVLARVRAVHRGELEDSRPGARMRGDGEFAESIAFLFQSSVARFGIPRETKPLSAASFRRPGETRSWF